MIKYKAKPIGKAEMRERVEQKFRARGAVLFHTLVFVLASGLFLAFLPTAWTRQFEYRFENAFIEAVLLYGIVATTFALNFFRYHYKHGAGYTKHQAETEKLTNRHLSRSDPDEWEDHEELLGIQQKNKLKNRRLLFQHLALFLGINSMLSLFVLSHELRIGWYPDETLLVPLYFTGAWGIGLVVHALRYYFAWGHSGGRRQAKIDAEVARELAALTQIEAVAATSGSDGEPRRTDQPSLGGVSLEELALGEAKIDDRASQ